MESKQPMIKHADEIDLFELLSRVILFFGKNLLAIAISLIVGIGLGIVYYKISPKEYESKMLISSDILTESYSKSLTDNLVKLIKENNTSTLSKELNLTPEQAAQLTGLEIGSAIEKAVNVPEESKMFLNVVARSRDNSIWPHLEKGILYYFESKEYVRVRVEQKKRFYSEMIEKINLELVDLERLKERFSQGSFAQTSKESLVVFDPTTVNSKIIDLSKEKISLRNALETVNSVQVVEGFIIFNKPSGPKLSISLAAGLSVGLFLAGIAIVFNGIRSVVKLSEEKLGKA